MKTCIPVADNRGLKSRVNEPFGKAPYHVIVDIDTRSREIFEKQVEEHEH